ncbi:MAG: phosphatidate cytidylyltransferase, partial [Candidatus Lokiarchaeota archaeon]|nr:phosphatidate cytidylyltransferase [Candidatus Lokiarchaeota archaeon]
MELEYWVFVESLYNTTLTLFFFVLMSLMYYIGVKGYRAKNRYGGISSILCGICFLIYGYYNSIIGFFTYPFMGFMVWWMGMVLILNLIFTTIIRRDIRKMKIEVKNGFMKEEQAKEKSILRRYIRRMTKENPYRKEIPFKMEIIRKSFHLSGFLLLIAYAGFLTIPPITSLVNDALIIGLQQGELLYNFIWGVSPYPFGFGDFQAIVEITMFALIGALVFTITSDIIRIIWGPEYSFFNFLTKSMLREKEKNAAGPQIYIITGIIFSFMLYMANIIPDIRVFFAGILIACLSDASAALIGRRFGKHKVTLRNKEIKSIEGFTAGVVVAYAIGFVFVGPIYAIMGAVIFFLTDYLPSITADNILNPIFIPIGIQLMVVLL